MLFNSYTFILLFWPLTWFLWRLSAGRRSVPTGVWILVLASWFFYGWWQPGPDQPRFLYLPLILFSIAFNFALGRRLSQGARRPGLLAVGIAVNLALLGYFKYTGFFLRSLRSALGDDFPVAEVTLPIAISFFTFQQIAYLVDAHRREVHETRLGYYSLFVSFFPQLIAGPIVHHKEVIPQFKEAARQRYVRENVVRGLFVFAVGLCKKVAIADGFDLWVMGLFDKAGTLSFFDAWGAVTAYSLQLYFDFSGYADMAIGIALTFNIELPENFNSPYKARNIVEFWRRWHMTLSRFLRDYLYIPLGGNRLGKVRRYLNLLLTMLLGGLWHGANWTFVIWGGLHGLYLVINHGWQRLGVKLPGAVAWATTLVAVMFGWAFFRSTSVERGADIASSMLGLNGFAFDSGPFSLGVAQFRWLALVAAVVLFAPNRQAITRWRWSSDQLFALTFCVLAVVGLLRLADPSPFLYFQF